MEKVVLAHKHETEEWYRNGYIALIKRAEPLDFKEAKLLGFEFALKIAKVREERYSQGTVHCMMTMRWISNDGYRPVTIPYNTTHQYCAVGDDALERLLKNTFDL